MVAVLAFLKQLETSKVMGKHHQTNIPGNMFLFFWGGYLKHPKMYLYDVHVRMSCIYMSSHIL